MAAAFSQSSRELMDRNNLIWAAAFGVAGAALGSLASILLGIVFVWAIISLFANRFDWYHTPTTKAFAILSALYGGTIVLFGLLHDTGDLISLVGLLVFFAPTFLACRLNLSAPASLLNWLVIGSAIGILFLAPVAGYQYFSTGTRASGFAGNPGVFAVTSLLFGAFGGLNTCYPEKWRKMLGSAAWLAMAFCVFTSEMRGIWLALLLVLPILVWACAPQLKGRRKFLPIVGALVVALAAWISVGDRVSDRLALFSSDMQQLEEHASIKSSTGFRLVLYQASFSAIGERPLAGYGLTNRMTAVRAEMADADANVVPNFTHPHNGFLAAMLDAGVLGLAAVIAMLICPPIVVMRMPRLENNEPERVRFACALTLTVVYICSGMTNIMFQHDVMDGVFIGAALLILAGRNPNSVQSNV